MNQEENNQIINSQCKKTLKQNFFIIFKLVMSILYFIPAFFINAVGLFMNIIFLMIAVLGSKSYIGTMAYISYFTILPTVLCIALFIITLISTIKFFVNKYNKIMDFIICVSLILFNVILLIFVFLTSFYIVTIILIVFLIILVLNLIDIAKKLNEKQIVE